MKTNKGGGRQKVTQDVKDERKVGGLEVDAESEGGAGEREMRGRGIC